MSAVIDESKLNKLLKKIDITCKPISDIRPVACGDVTKKYKKKDYEQLIHLAYNMYICLQESTASIKKLHMSLASTNVELNTLKEESKAAMSDVLNQSMEKDENQGATLVIEEVRRNRAEIIELKREIKDQTTSVREETAKFKSYAQAAQNKVSVKPVETKTGTNYCL